MGRCLLNPALKKSQMIYAVAGAGSLWDKTQASEPTGCCLRLPRSVLCSSSSSFVMDLHELAPVGRWAPGGCDRWRLERFAKMGQDLPDRPWFRDERDQPNVTAAVRALKRKLLPHPRHELGPGNP